MTDIASEQTYSLATLVRLRHELCQTLRRHLLHLGAVEVTTPILHRCPDVAPTQQFTTVHPVTGERSFLRIAPTENLKRLMVAGMEHVFEFSVNFRDDMADATHLPEFTSLEVMARGARCRDMERLAVECCQIAFQVARRTMAAAILPAWLSSAVQAGHVPVKRVWLAGELHTGASGQGGRACSTWIGSGTCSRGSAIQAHMTRGIRLLRSRIASSPGSPPRPVARYSSPASRSI